jgi:hypothetical protein
MYRYAGVGRVVGPEQWSVPRQMPLERTETAFKVAQGSDRPQTTPPPSTGGQKRSLCVLEGMRKHERRVHDRPTAREIGSSR